MVFAYAQKALLKTKNSCVLHALSQVVNNVIQTRFVNHALQINILKLIHKTEFAFVMLIIF